MGNELSLGLKPFVLVKPNGTSFDRREEEDGKLVYYEQRRLEQVAIGVEFPNGEVGVQYTPDDSLGVRYYGDMDELREDLTQSRAGHEVRYV